uniref:Homeobox domain-containing protein n=1 Tax=Globodera pallida TaxID=36090 RepID=A0A183C6U8_GLOPA
MASKASASSSTNPCNLVQLQHPSASCSTSASTSSSSLKYPQYHPTYHHQHHFGHPLGQQSLLSLNIDIQPNGRFGIDGASGGGHHILDIGISQQQMLQSALLQHHDQASAFIHHYQQQHHNELNSADVLKREQANLPMIQSPGSRGIVQWFLMHKDLSGRYRMFCSI